MDILIIEASSCSFFLFFTLQCIVFRFLPVDQVLKGLKNISAAGGILNLALTATLASIWHQSWGIVGLTICLGLSFILYGLMVAVYIFCIFGPYETSLRMRIVREIHGAGPKGLTMESLLKNYNIRKILQIRLERLTGAGDVVLKDSKYHLYQHFNMFFIVEAIANQLQRWIEPGSPE